MLNNDERARDRSDFASAFALLRKTNDSNELNGFIEEQLSRKGRTWLIRNYKPLIKYLIKEFQNDEDHSEIVILSPREAECLLDIFIINKMQDYFCSNIIGDSLIKLIKSQNVDRLYRLDGEHLFDELLKDISVV